MYSLLNSGLVTRAAFRVAIKGGFGRSVGFGRPRLSGGDRNSKDSLSRLWKAVERRAVERADRIKKAGSADVRFLFVFPAVFSSSLFHDAKHLALLEEKPHHNNNNLDIKSYATRGSLVRYLYKTWDLIRFLLSLTKFIMLYSPFLFTYPLCHLSSTLEDLWWVLFKKAIVLGGPITVEFAKWLGTREDLFLHKTCVNLASVSHREQPHSWYSTKKKLRRALGKQWQNTVVQFEPERKEMAKSELAQVYKAKLPLDSCSDQVAEEIVKDVDDFEGLEEPFLSDGIEIVGLGAWMSGHDEDDIVDDAFGSWMMTKQGLALYQSDGDQGVRSGPIVIPPPSDVVVSDPAPSEAEVKLKLRQRIRDRIHNVQQHAAEKVVHAVSRGWEACHRAVGRSYALMAKVGTMRQELQIVPDPFDLTPAIPPKPIAERISSDDGQDKLYLEELLPELQDSSSAELTSTYADSALSVKYNSVNNVNNNNVNNNNVHNNNVHNNDDVGDSFSHDEGDSRANTGAELLSQNATPSFTDDIVSKEDEAAAADLFPAALPSLLAVPETLLAVPDAIVEKVEMLEQELQREMLDKIPELTPEEVAIDEMIEAAEETQPHIPESVSEGVEALLQIGAEAVKSAKDGVKEGVAQMKETVAPFANIEQVEEESGEPEESFLLQHHPAECECRLCQGLVPVAIKVLHPGIVRRSIRDLDVLHLLAGFVQLFVPWMSWWRPATCVDEFGDRLHRMINLKREAIALERFNFNFVANPNVRFPRPMRPFVHRDVLVEMWEESDNLEHYLMTEDGGEDRSLMPFSLRSSLAEIISEAFVKMVFEDNYVHCDINLNNVLVQNGKYFIENPPDKEKLIQVEVMDTIVITTEENRNPLRLVFCDVDVASCISHPRAFANIFEGIFNGDASQSAAAFDPFISESSRTKDLARFKDELTQCFHRHSTSRDGISADLALLVEDIYRVLYYNKVKMEDDFVAVLTSMLAVETIGKKLIGRNQNLFHAIGKHFAMQSDGERV